ncbi:MAG: hypothetical protein ACI8PZ_006403 [Myxococcota bacterium]|jgi:sulfur relay (sulfurtransferase) complex TusBCD TusD component (DsrE family)
MADYTLLSSRDPVGSDPLVHQLAVDLAKAGHTVTLFLVENGTFLARVGVFPEVREALLAAGVEVLADDFALAERGILDGALAPGVLPSSLERVVDDLAAGRRVSWH